MIFIQLLLEYLANLRSSAIHGYHWWYTARCCCTVMMSPPFSSVVGWLQIPWFSQDSCSWVGEVGCDSSLNFLVSDFWGILSCTEVVHDFCTSVSPSLGSSCISKFVNKSKSTNGCLPAVSGSLNLTLTLSSSLLFVTVVTGSHRIISESFSSLFLLPGVVFFLLYPAHCLLVVVFYNIISFFSNIILSSPTFFTSCGAVFPRSDSLSVLSYSPCSSGGTSLGGTSLGGTGC